MSFFTRVACPDGVSVRPKELQLVRRNPTVQTFLPVCPTLADSFNVGRLMLGLVFLLHICLLGGTPVFSEGLEGSVYRPL